MKKIKQLLNLKELFFWIIIVACIIFLATNANAQGRPGACNTGPSGTLTSATVGTITVDGTVIENVISGPIKVKANNVTIRNCKISGGTYGIDCDEGNYTGILIEDCEIINSQSAGIIGSHFTARRCNIHDSGNDAFKPRWNVLIESCWAHHLGVSDSSHADAVQIVNGNNIIVRGNFFEGPIVPGTAGNLEGGYKMNAAFMIDDNPNIEVLIEGNWMDGGNWTINIDKITNGCPDVTIINNHFSGQYRSGAFTGRGCPITFTGNIIDPPLTSTIPQCGSITGTPVDATGINISSELLNMEVNTDTDLNYSLIPSNASNQNATWSSTEPSVATVNSNGLVTAMAAGSTTITVTSSDGGFTADCDVTVYPVGTLPTNVALNKPVTASAENAPNDLKEELVDGNTSGDSRWSADGFPQWAIIDLQGTYDLSSIEVVTYQDRDYQYIVEASLDGVSYSTIVDRSTNTEGSNLVDAVSATASYLKITVTGANTYTGTWASINELIAIGTNSGTTIPVSAISLSPISLSLEYGQSPIIIPIIDPISATNKSVVWSSDNEPVATVEQNGQVTAVAEGVANITATTVDGGFSASCTVTVTDVVPPTGGFYCDPVNGSMANDGSQSSPWGSLQEVIAAGKTFADGETIYLMNGNHGFPVISESNTSDVTITKAAGNNPVIQRISFNGASHWLLKDVEVSTEGLRVPTDPPLEYPVYPIIENSLVQISNNSSYITISDCYINSVDNSINWTAEDWNYNAWNGVYHTNTDHVTVKNCLIKNVNFGIHNTNGTTVSNTLLEYNTIENFNGDGLRGHGINTVIQYNTVKNCYATNGNHRDMLQVVGTTTGLILRGNKFIAYTDPNQPFKTGCQGIALFDGMFYDFVIENNVVFTEHYHGITLLGAQNCKVINNTVIDMNDNALWIQIGDHNDGTPSTGNIVRNNLCSKLNNAANIGEVDNNLIVQFGDRDTYFTDFAGSDLSLKSGCGAIDAGIATEAPSIDIDGNPRPQGSGYDIGAYEYNGVFIDETSVIVTPASLSIEAGQTGNLTKTIEPSNASNQTVTWSSDSPSVATVNTSGVVSALSEGTAIITATTNNLGLTSSSTITVLPPSGDYNLALGKTVTTSSDDASHFGSNLVDNDLDTRWSAEIFPQSATVDLGQECNLSSIEVYTYLARAYQYTIEVSNDGTTFTQIVDRSSNTSATQPIADDIATTGRYVKITVSGADGYTGPWVSITELKVIGSTIVVESNNSPTIDAINDIATLEDAGQQIVSLSGISDGDGNTQIVSVSATSSDINIVDNVSVTYTSGNATGTLTFEPIAEGTATITVTVVDDGGTLNGGVDTKVISFNVTVNSIGGLPAPWTNGDVGDVSAAGSVTYSGGIFTVEGSGWNIWNTADEFQFVYQQITGDAVITARVTSLEQVHQWTKGGVMMRESLGTSSINGNTFIAPIASNGSKFSYRAATGATSSEFDGPNVTAPYWVRMERSGNTFTGSVSADGITWTALGSTTLNMSSTYYVGLSVVSLSDGTLATATFDNVTVQYNSTISVTGVTLNQSELTLDEEETYDLDETVSPADATDKSVIWSSSDDLVATVDSDGFVTAVTEGTAIITVSTNDGGYTAACDITVVAPPVPYLIDEDFSAGASDFTEIAGGTWAVSGGRYVLSSPANGGTGLLGNISVHNTEVTGDFELSTLFNITSTTSAWNDAAVVFNFQDINNYCYVSLNESNDVNSKGIFKVVNDVPTELADITATITDDTDYNLEIIKTGADIVVKLDGTEIASATDATLTGGKVGYGSKNDGGQFDNLLVSATGTSVIDPTSITLDQTSVSLDEGLTVQLAETVLPIDATDPSVSWSTDNSDVATVSNGLVDALAAGTATITATTVNGLTATCIVTVTEPIIYPASITLDQTSVSLNEGITVQLAETVLPIDATDPSVSWSTDNSDVATVSNGLVDALTAGTATITATTVNGLTATCIVTVIEPPTVWDVITYDDFESGWGNYTDAGGDCNLYIGGTYAHQGNNAAQIQDNQGVNSSFYYTSSVDLQAYQQLKIEFWFYGLGMDDGHDFFVEYSDDGGSTWQSIAQYVQGSGSDFVNSQFYSVSENGDLGSIIIDDATYNFSANAKIRFRCDGMYNGDQIYIDEVSVTATASATKSSFEKTNVELDNSTPSINIFPNPCNGNFVTININETLINDITNIQIYDISGKLIQFEKIASSDNQNSITLNTNNLAKGLYVISVINGNEIYKEKIVINK